MTFGHKRLGKAQGVRHTAPFDHELTTGKADGLKQCNNLERGEFNDTENHGCVLHGLLFILSFNGIWARAGYRVGDWGQTKLMV